MGWQCFQRIPWQVSIVLVFVFRNLYAGQRKLLKKFWLCYTIFLSVALKFACSCTPFPIEYLKSFRAVEPEQYDLKATASRCCEHQEHWLWWDCAVLGVGFTLLRNLWVHVCWLQLRFYRARRRWFGSCLWISMETFWGQVNLQPSSNHQKMW